MLKLKLRLLSSLFFVIYSQQCLGIVCSQAFAVTKQQHIISNFLHKVESRELIPLSFRQFIREVSRGSQNYLILGLPKVDIWFESYWVEGHYVLVVKNIDWKDSHFYEKSKTLDELTFSLIKIAQNFYKENPNTQSVRITMPPLRNDDLTLKLRALGFLYAGKHLYLRLNPRELITPPPQN